MDLYALLVKHIIYPLWMLKDGSACLKYLKEYEKTQWWSKERINELQWEKLQKMLKHAYLNCPFYKDRFDSIGLRPENIKNPQDFLNIPLLTKKDIQENPDKLKARNYPPQNLVQNRTGGSTGMPLLFYHNKKRMDTRLAATLRHNRWAHFDIGDKVAILWGSRYDHSLFEGWKASLRNSILDRALVLDTSSITPEKMRQFAQKIKRFKPKVFLGYATSLYLFACFVESENISGINPQGIISSAEALEPYQREKIEKVFGCEVFDRYGCRETSIIASECEKHSGLHINSENLYVEVISNKKPVEAGQIGEIVITDLLNFGMPFIRYKIEDVGKMSKESCLCGRGLPLMEMAGGRAADFIVTSEGKYVAGGFFLHHLLTKIDGIKQAQIVQKEMDSIVLKIVKGKELTQESLGLVKEDVADFLGKKMKVDFDFVEEIPKEASGKYRFCISKITPDFMR